MLRKLLQRFKNVFTVQDWKLEAQDAMKNKEFVVEALSELHRVERTKNENIAREQERNMGRNTGNQRGYNNGYSNQRGFNNQRGYSNGSYSKRDNYEHEQTPSMFSGPSLAELLNGMRDNS